MKMMFIHISALNFIKGARVLGTPKVYCRQFDPRHYQQETVKTTNDALAELYTQVVNMPDNHPMKKQFLDDVSYIMFVSN